MRVTILPTNHIHGRVVGLARVATLVERIRDGTPHRVIYVDAGDVEETTTRLSNLTKGVAMHREAVEERLARDSECATRTR